MNSSRVHEIIREFDNSEDAHHIIEQLDLEGIIAFELTCDRCVECGGKAYSIHPSSGIKYPDECGYCGKMACYPMEVIEI